MKAQYLTILFALLASFSSCKKSTLVNDKTDNGKPEETTTVELKNCLQKTFGAETISLCFDSVEDSRCPIDAVCVWQGVAKAGFTFSVNGNPHVFVLGTTNTADVHTETTVQRYKISLINVTPNPHSTTPGKPAAEVRITKL